MFAEVAIVSTVENPDIFPENVPSLWSISRIIVIVTIAEKSDTFPRNVRTKLAGRNASTVENSDTCSRNAQKLLEPTLNSVKIVTQLVIRRVIVINRGFGDPDLAESPRLFNNLT